MPGKKQVEFSARALNAIISIEAFIALGNVAAARRVADAIMNAAGRLADDPEIGKLGRNAGTRELILKRYPYTIVYRLTVSKVRIVAVVHQSRQYP